VAFNGVIGREVRNMTREFWGRSLHFSEMVRCSRFTNPRSFEEVNIR